MIGWVKPESWSSDASIILTCVKGKWPLRSLIIPSHCPVTLRRVTVTMSPILIVTISTDNKIKWVGSPLKAGLQGRKPRELAAWLLLQKLFDSGLSQVRNSALKLTGNYLSPIRDVYKLKQNWILSKWKNQSVLEWMWTNRSWSQLWVSRNQSCHFLTRKTLTWLKCYQQDFSITSAVVFKLTCNIINRNRTLSTVIIFGRPPLSRINLSFTGLK